MKCLFLCFVLYFPLISSAQVLLSDTSIIKDHLLTLTKTPRFRTYEQIDQLNTTAAYIHKIFMQYSDSVYYQDYSIDNSNYKNVICSFGTKNNKGL